MPRLTDEQLRGWAASGEPPLNKVAAELLAFRALGTLEEATKKCEWYDLMHHVETEADRICQAAESEDGNG